MAVASREDGPGEDMQVTLRECPGCGLFQLTPTPVPGTTAQCGRCGTTLHRARRHPFEKSAALSLTSVVLLSVMCLATLMTVSTSGIVNNAGLFSGPEELVRRGMAALAVVVVFVTVVAPMAKLLGTLYVLFRLREPGTPRHLRTVFALVVRLSPWSMLDVFVFGVFVAYVKLGDLVKIELDTGVYALLALTFVLVWTDSALDHEAVWNRLDRADAQRDARIAIVAGRVPAWAVSCETCTLVVLSKDHEHGCPRCGSALHARKPDSIAWTWALVIAAAALYVPANVYPVLTVMQFGAGQPSTILGGVRELISSGMYPLAALVFFASVAVPMLKLIGLTTMLVATRTRRSGWLRDRTRLYHVVRWIGRWSMIDIFMEALLGALVQFGGVITIEPGIGAMAFCGVVILTMFAAETFDPRIMWDVAQERASLAAVPRRAGYDLS
jgi:paraquat-inducible protein A